jgi:hypothetical protein
MIAITKDLSGAKLPGKAPCHANRLFVDPFLEKMIHIFPVRYDINRSMEPFLRIIFYADKHEQIRLCSTNHHIYITIGLSLSPGKRTENTDGDNAVCGLKLSLPFPQNSKSVFKIQRFPFHIFTSM